MKRDFAWFEQCWEKYIKPRYRKALHAFDKRTGGGSGSKFDMHDYCDRKNRLESWIYLLDLEHDGFLASFCNTKGPKTIHNEPGYESSNELDNDAINIIDATRSSMKKNNRRNSFDDDMNQFEKKMDEHMKEIKTDRFSLFSAISHLGGVIEKALVPPAPLDNVTRDNNPEKNNTQTIDGDEMELLLKNYNEALDAKTKFVQNPLTENSSVVLYTLDFKLAQAEKALEEYWNKRGEDYQEAGNNNKDDE
jgi:hypothetical protein